MYDVRNKSLVSKSKARTFQSVSHNLEEMEEEYMTTYAIPMGGEARYPIKCNTKLDPRIKVSGIGDILRLPQIVQVRGDFNEESAELFANDFHTAESSGQDIVPIVIDSYGGDIYSLLSMIDIIESSVVPVATIGIGKAMSAGAVLLSCGNDGLRFCSPNATVMIHSAWEAGISGNADEVKVNAEELMRLNHKVLEILSINCGHTKDYFHKIMSAKKNTDWFLSAREAKKHKIINEIRIPEFFVEVSAKVEFK